MSELPASAVTRSLRTKRRRTCGSATAFLVGITLAGSVVASCQGGSSIATVTQSTMGPRAQLTGSVIVTALDMISPATGWADAFELPFAGAYPAVRRLILRTTEGGQSWRNVTPRGLPPQVQGVAPTEYLDQDRAWVMGLVAPGQIGVMGTTDGGASWRETIIHDPRVDYQLSDTGSAQITFVDANHGWLFVSYGNGADEAGALYKTVDGGAHWAVASRTNPDMAAGTSVPWQGFKTGLTFVNQGDGWLTVTSGSKPLLYSTHDAGTNWFPVPYPDVPGIDLSGRARSLEAPLLHARFWRVPSLGGTFRGLHHD